MRQRAGGFTLLEVLIAFALLAAAMTLLLGSLSGASRLVGQADQRSRAVLHAQSLLAVAGVEEPLQPGRRQGQWEQGRYRWSLDVAPYVEPRVAPMSADGAQALGGPRLMQLNLQVEWGTRESERLRWQTLRLLPQALEAAQ